MPRANPPSGNFMAIRPERELETRRPAFVLLEARPFSMRAAREFFGAIACGFTPSSKRCASGLDARMIPEMSIPVAAPPEKNLVLTDLATRDDGASERATPPASRPAMTNAALPAARRGESFQNTCAWTNCPPYVTPRIRTGVAITCRPRSSVPEASSVRTSPSTPCEGRLGRTGSRNRADGRHPL